MEKTRNTVMALRSKMDVGNEIRSNRELLKTIKFDEILGECGLYFTSTKSTAAMNAEDFMKAHGGSGSAEFVLAIHLVPIRYIDISFSLMFQGNFVVISMISLTI